MDVIAHDAPSGRQHGPQPLDVPPHRIAFVVPVEKNQVPLPPRHFGFPCCKGLVEWHHSERNRLLHACAFPALCSALRNARVPFDGLHPEARRSKLRCSNPEAGPQLQHLLRAHSPPEGDERPHLSWRLERNLRQFPYGPPSDGQAAGTWIVPVYRLGFSAHPPPLRFHTGMERYSAHAIEPSVQQRRVHSVPPARPPPPPDKTDDSRSPNLKHVPKVGCFVRRNHLPLRPSGD